MQLNELSELNINVLKYLNKGKTNQPLIANPNSVPDPYYQQGSHPDVVERIWDQIASALPKDCRCLVYGIPALVHPKSGIIFAFTGGTVYYLRVPSTLVNEILQSGVRTYAQRAEGDIDTQRDLGSDWIFGTWSSKEIEWCNMLFTQLNEISKTDS
jgi:hypothetical protein